MKPRGDWATLAAASALLVLAAVAELVCIVRAQLSGPHLLIVGLYGAAAILTGAAAVHCKRDRNPPGSP